MRDGGIYWRVIEQARPYWIHLAGITALGLLSIPLTLLTPLPLKIAVDSGLGRKPFPFPFRLFFQGSEHSVTTVLALAVVLLVAIALLTYLEGLASTLLQTFA